MLTELTNQAKVVGAKQVKRAIEAGTARKVFLAGDADTRVTEPVAALCEERGVAVEIVPSMRDIGKTCGIAVGAAVAALVGG